ncbi:MAG: hypothetical protein V3V97_07825 [Hyphomicrobiaceae bacterium]
MDRRAFIKSTAVAAGVAAASSSVSGAPATHKSVVELRMVVPWPSEAVAVHAFARRLATRVERASDSQLRLHLVGTGDEPPNGSCLDILANGDAELYLGSELWHAATAPALGFFAGLPFGLDAGEFATWLASGGGQVIWDEAGDAVGVKPMLAGVAGPAVGTWSADPITSVDAYKGLRTHAPGHTAEIVAALGATHVALSASDVVPAMADGRIRATSYAGPYLDMQLGLNRSATYHHTSALHPSSFVLSVGIRRKLWADLTANQRVLIEACLAAERDTFNAELATNGALARRAISTQPAIATVEIPPASLSEMRQAASDMLRTIAIRDLTARKAYDSQLGFRAMMADHASEPKPTDWAGV